MARVPGRTWNPRFSLPLANREVIKSSNSVTERSIDEQTVRPRSGNARFAGAENSGIAAAQRLGHQPATKADFRRCSAGERRISLSLAAQAGAGRLDRRRVETE